MRPSNRVVAAVLATLVCSVIAGRAKAGPASPDFVIRGDTQADPVSAQPAPAPAPNDAPDPLAAPQPDPAPAVAGEPVAPAVQDNATLASAAQPVGLWHPGVDALSPTQLPMAAASSTDSLNGRDPQQAMVPLPTAAWTGLSTLLGLAVIRFARNFRQILN